MKKINVLFFLLRSILAFNKRDIMPISIIVNTSKPILFFNAKTTKFLLLLVFILNGVQIYSQTPTLIGSQKFSAVGSGASGVPSINYNIPAGSNRVMVITCLIERYHNPVHSNMPTGLPDEQILPILDIAVGGVNTITSFNNTTRSPQFPNTTMSGTRQISYLSDANGLPTGNTAITFPNINLPNRASDEMSVIITVYSNVKNIVFLGNNNEVGIATTTLATFTGTPQALPVGRVVSDILYVATGGSSQSNTISASAGWTSSANLNNVIINSTGASAGAVFSNEPDGISHMMAYRTYATAVNPTVTFSRISTQNIQSAYANMFALIPFAKPAVSGSVLIDNSGTSDGINGTAYTSGNLYVNAVDTNGNVIATAVVNASGNFTFSAGGNITEDNLVRFKLSRNQGTVGQPEPAQQLPTGWLTVGENSTGVSPFPADGNNNGIMSINIGTSNIAGIRFGITDPCSSLPATPTVSVVAPTCSANGTATITNYVSTQAYTFTPSGPTVGAGGVISGSVAGTSYTVTTTNASGCTSGSSTSFTRQNQLITPSVPTVSVVAPTCSANGTATITNYVSTQAYTFTPSGPTVGAGGVISGAVAGTSYTVTTTNASGCTSGSSTSFIVLNSLAGTLPDSDGDGISDVCDLDDDNDGILDAQECTATPQILNGWYNTATYAAGFWPASIPDAIAYNSVSGSGITRTLIGSPGNYQEISSIDAITELQAITNNEYVQYDIKTGNTPFVITQVGYYRTVNTQNNTPYTFSARISSDNFATNNIIHGSVNYTPPATGTDMTVNVLNGPLYLNANKNYSFRVYFYNPTVNSSAKIAHDDFKIIGYKDCDTDGDGITNRLDLDSDNDGCSDAIEGGSSTITSANLVNSSMLGGNNGATSGTFNQPVTQNLGNAVDAISTSISYGVPTIAGSGQTVGTSQTANPILVAGSLSADQTISSGSIPTMLSLAGATGSIQWQVSNDNLTFTNIPAATSSTYDPGSLIATRYYRVIVTSDGGCTAISNTIKITVIEVCYRDPINNGTGTETKMGITLLKRAGSDNQDNWPMVRKSGYIALESNTQGFVVTRIAKADLGNITNPQEGMMLYDTTDKCLKIYSDNAWKCFSTPACP